VVAEAANVDEAVHLSRSRRPDVCVVAVELPGSGIEAARMIKQALPATRIVMMTSSQRDEDLFEALRAGADGYLLMSTSADRLPHAILGVACGEAALPRPLTARLISEFRQRGAKRRVLVSPGRGEVELTAREFEVLERLRKREATADIATHLGISQVTVRRHVASVMRKLGVSNRRQAIELLEEAERAAPPGTASPVRASHGPAARSGRGRSCVPPIACAATGAPAGGCRAAKCVSRTGDISFPVSSPVGGARPFAY
jgi:DNA-binding NarL/FixJ family response regulator